MKTKNTPLSKFLIKPTLFILMMFTGFSSLKAQVLLDAHSSGGGATTWYITTTQPNELILIATDSYGSLSTAAGTVTVNGNNATYENEGLYNSGDAWTASIWAYQAAVAGTYTLVCTESGAISPFYFNYAASVYEPATTLTLADIVIGGNSNSQTNTGTASITTTVANSYIYGASCFNDNGGSGTITWNSSLTELDHLYISDGIDADQAGITEAVAGTYPITVTDNGASNPWCAMCLIAVQPSNNSCTLTTTASVNTNVSCYGNSDGSATANPSAGSTPYTYLWNDGASQTTVTASGLSAGNYTVTVTDNIGCTAIASVSITQPGQIQICGGGPPTTITFSYTGSLQNLTIPAGVSQVTVDAIGAAGGYTNGGYGAEIEGSFGVTPGDILDVLAGGQGAYLNYAGGGGGGSFVWNTTGNVLYIAAGGGGGGNVCGEAGANASVTTTPVAGGSAGSGAGGSGGNGGAGGAGPDGNPGYPATGGGGCGWLSNGADGTIGTYLGGGGIDPANGGAGGFEGDPTFGAVGGYGGGGGSGGHCGAAGGGGGYNGGGGANIWNGSQWGGAGGAGSYNGGTVILANAGIGTGNGSVTISYTSNGGITTTDASCNNNDGSVNVSCVSGGTGAYTYSWSPGGATTAAISGLSADTYTVTIMDANGCSITASATITQASQVVANATVTSNTSACGSLGSASSSPTGGTAPYTYTWSNSATTSSISALSAGTYTLTVNDNGGCSNTASVTITAPANVVANASVTSNTSACGSLGSASSTPTGGDMPYTYSWSTSETTSNISALSAGIYTLTVTDNSGCTATDAVTITAPASVVANASVTSNSSACASSGSASSTPTGGDMPYTYSWSTSETTSSISTLSAGTYTLTVTDNDGCTATDQVTITAPASLVANASVTSNSTSCASSGSASSSPTGGNSPYNYSWSNSATTSSISALSAGTYTLTVTDNDGCTATDQVTITAPAGINVTDIATANVSCNGNSDGSATSAVTGGTMPYTYSWSNSATTSSISALSAGTYTLNVTDNDGCSGTASVTITEPAPFAILHDSTAQNGPCDGMAGVTVSGGTAPYTYLWTTGGQTNDTIQSQCSGTYCCVITDNNGCSTTTCVTVNDITGLLGLTKSSAIEIYPNPTSGQFVITGLASGMIVEIYDYTGKKICTLQAKDNSPANVDITNLADGVYLTRIVDKNGNLIEDKKIVKTQ